MLQLEHVLFLTMRPVVPPDGVIRAGYFAPTHTAVRDDRSEYVANIWPGLDT